MKDRLVTPSYCFILAANFLLYFGFWLLMPVLPFYLSEIFKVNNATVGIILSCYTIAALCIRPFSGYLLDTFARKPLYLFAYIIFTVIFGGYLLAGLLPVFIMMRVVQGVAFGMVTVGGNTIVIDIMPSSRRGEGLGYYGLANNIAMSVGPMAGLFLHDTGTPYPFIFCAALGSCFAGFLCALMVKTPYKPPVKREPISLDRFILLKGIPAGVSLLLLSIPYGMTTNYVAMYARQIDIPASTGFFFTFMALGMAVSRLFSGRLVDKGKITQVIAVALYGVIASFFLLWSCVYVMRWNPHACTFCSLASPCCWASVLAPCFRPITRCLSALPPTASGVRPHPPTSLLGMWALASACWLAVTFPKSAPSTRLICLAPVSPSSLPFISIIQWLPTSIATK